jgi:AraC family transcriptional regulator
VVRGQPCHVADEGVKSMDLEAQESELLDLGISQWSRHAEGQAHRKYPKSILLRSSYDLGWAALLGEVRSHRPFEGPGTVAPHAEVAIAVCGSDAGTSVHKVSGAWHTVRPTTGTLWLKPAGAKSEEVRNKLSRVDMLHLYLPDSVFRGLAADYPLSAMPAGSFRHSLGVRDDLINQIGLSMLSEMVRPTSAGRMLVETSSVLLAARLMQAHFETGPLRPPIRSRDRLDPARLQRVLAYVEEHLADDIAVADIANVACLSLFHFTRAFAAAMGVPPHRYVSQRRLEAAKAMIAAGRASLYEIALDCRFSSQSSFTRAFRSATGMTPAEYRRRTL